MHENENPITAAPKRVPWNKGKLIGPRPQLKQKHVWAIRTRLQLERQVRDLALFNLAIDSKLRGCDLVAIRVDDVAPNGYAIERASVRQRKTGRPVRFELTEQTRLAIDEYLTRGGKKAANFAVTHNAALGRLWPDGAICMRRRDFIGLLGGVAVGWPLAARAQRSGSVWRIGFITHTANDAAYASLFERLRELGYLEGQNIIVERRYAEGRAERFQEFAAEMVRLKADVVITSTTPAALALRNATTTIPIVIPTAIDPIGTGLIASLAHPGGNITEGRFFQRN